jgi:cellulose synthase/poly-beta-1,6-N-acetylglucosamine synthase-like glycosyltransferase
VNAVSIVLVAALALLGWAWIGYPVLIVALSRLRSGRTVTAPTTSPTVTVVIATNGDAISAAERIRDIRATAYPSALLDTVLGVDASLAPELRGALHALTAAGITVVDGDGPGGKAATLNAAVRAARGEVLVFTDVQQRFDPDAITILVSTMLADDRVSIVGGALQLPGDRDPKNRSPVEWYWAAERLLRNAEACLHSSIGVSGSIYAMRRAAWSPMPGGLILDDVYVPMQQVLAGKRVAYALTAKAWDTRRTSADTEQKRKVRTLTGNFQLVAWLPALLIPIRNPVWLQFVSHKLLRLATPWLVLCIAGAMLVHVANAGTESVLFRGAAVVTVVLLVAAVVPPTGRKVRGLARWVVSLNTALVRASLNGARGHWDVW